MDVRFVMFKRDGQRKDFLILHDKTVIGRAEDCELRIPLLSVSRQHCEVTTGADALTVRDLGSSNGTYVNGQRVTEKALRAGDRLGIGPIVFTVQVDGEPKQIKPIRSKIPAAAAGAPAGKGAEVIDLEADIEGDEPAEEVDPIAALEALASKQKKQPPKDKS